MSLAQREELLGTPKARFEKNMNRHKGLEWAKVQAKLKANPEKLRSLNEMENTDGEPDVVGYDKKPANYFSLIVHPRVLKAAEVFVTIKKRWTQENKINWETARWIWLSQWALSCYRKNSIASYRNLEIST